MKSGNEIKKMSLFALSWPIFAELFLQILLGNVDTLMLSQYSDHAMTAVSVSVELLNAFVIMFGFVSVGTGILTSQYLGANDQEKVTQTVTVSFILNFIFGAVISGLFVFGSDFLLGFMEIPKELHSDAATFLKITGGFLFTQAIINTASAVLRSHGMMKDSFRINIVMNILNIIGNSGFLFGLFGMPILGVKGVAISTTFARCVSMTLMLLLLWKKTRHVISIKSIIPFPKEICKNLLFIGMPSAGENLAYQGSQIMITRVISTFMGTLALTTRAYARTISMFIFLFPVAIAFGTQVVVGHMVGAGEVENAYERCLRTLKIALGVTTGVSILFALAGGPIISIFTKDPEVISMTKTILWVAILLESGRTFNIVIINSLKAAGDVVFPLWMGIFSMFAIGVLGSYFFGVTLNMGIVGIWLAYASDEWFRGIAMLWRWRSRRWQGKSFVTNNEIVEVV